VKEYPILMNGPMVRATLEGRKTVTRRTDLRWAKVKAGDLLWVRETFTWVTGPTDGSKPTSDNSAFYYRADSTVDLSGAWKPSIHMPRLASRITLRATEDARVERLQDITDEEAVSEGVERVSDRIKADNPGLDEKLVAAGSSPMMPLWRNYRLSETHWMPSARESFSSLWESINGPGSWAENPQVARVAFEVVR
jgi:hypothetical protein